MNAYEQHLEDRKARLLERAEKKDQEADAHFNRSQDAVAGIPFGQPILVGHHSEKRHRKDLERSDNAMRRSCEARDQAKRLRARAAGVGKAGISSDDPDAIAKLEAKLETLQEAHGKMKAFNAAWRKHKRPGSNDLEAWEKIKALGILGASLVDALRESMADAWVDVPFAPYQLSNSSANMKRLRERIAELKSTIGRESSEVEHEDLDLTVTENVDENRIQLMFGSRPPKETCRLLRRQGFRWAPSIGVWQRQLNNAGIYAARSVIDALRQGQ